MIYIYVRHYTVAQSCFELLGAPQACLGRVRTGLAMDVKRIATAFRRFDSDHSEHLDDTEILRRGRDREL